EGLPLVALLALFAFLLSSPGTLTTAMAQRLMPGDAGTSASLITGLALGLGGVGATVFGRLADIIGLTPALHWLAWWLLAPAALTLLLPRVPRSLRRG
ncbi:MAG: MFS transporter, partial [Chloroflexi bacterium]|nr:MFS transporter [Chloroflexota bacterium]